MFTTRAALIAFAAAVVTSTALAAGPVQSYSRSPDPSRSEGLRTQRDYLPLGDPRPGDPLLTPAPWPDNRTDSPDREQNGRLWFPRIKVGTRSPLAELPLGTPGAASFGASPEMNDQLIWVRPKERLPVLAVSPFVDLDKDTTDEIERNVPQIGRYQTRFYADAILRELEEAQHQWLREQGYILKVRTHKNPATLVNGGASKPRIAEADEKSTPEPRAVIKVRERANEDELPPPRAQTPANGEAARVMNAGAPASKPAPVVVVRRAGPSAAAETK